MPLVFLVIIGTVMIQGLGAKMVGNFLGVREPETNGILVVGSNPVALLVATSLKDQGFDVIVAHNNYTNIASARMSGLRTYFGNPVSDHADHHLDRSLSVSQLSVKQLPTQITPYLLSSV